MAPIREHRYLCTMSVLAYLLCVAIVAGMMSGTGQADELSKPPQATAPCRDDYNAALEGVRDELKSYIFCLSKSRGTDPCASEFKRLRRVHERMESAVRCNKGRNRS
jgi:hypothetical protein